MRDFASACSISYERHTTKKPRTSPRLFLLKFLPPEASLRSVLRDQRPVELVAHPGDSGLNIARFRIETIHAERGAELIAPGFEGRIVIFEAENPVLGNSVFPARAD